jgi:hypothetical protein
MMSLLPSHDQTRFYELHDLKIDILIVRNIYPLTIGAVFINLALRIQ